MVQRLSTLPGVESAELSHFPPANLNFPLSKEPVARVEETGTTSEFAALLESVSPGFFGTLEMSLVRRRDFTWYDAEGTPPVGILNALLSQRLFPAGDAIGRRIRVGGAPTIPGGTSSRYASQEVNSKP